MESECLRAHRKGREVYVYTAADGLLPGGNQSLLEKGCSPIPAPGARSLLVTLSSDIGERERYSQSPDIPLQEG
jgi:hypothetical protein